jgi:hypothetical protein
VRAAGGVPSHRPADAPFHVGVLLDNVPEFWIMLGAAAISGATLVGINPTRRGADLARDVTHTDCALLVTETEHLALLEGAADAVPNDALFVTDTPAWDAALAPFAGAALPDVEVTPRDIFMLIFTSGTTGAPKAVRISHGKLAAWGSHLAARFPLVPDDICYSVMPLFHSNAQVAGYTAPLSAGSTTVLRRKFSAGFLPDVRKYSVTFFNYVAEPSRTCSDPGPMTPTTPADRLGNERPIDIDVSPRFGSLVIRMARPRRHQHVQDRRHAGGLARHADRRVPRRDHRSRRQGGAGDLRRARPPLNAEAAIGEIVNPDERAASRATTTTRKRMPTHARRQVLDRRSRVPRRRRLLLFRGSQLRLVARGRRELRGRAGRASAVATPRCGAGGRLRGAVTRRR